MRFCPQGKPGEPGSSAGVEGLGGASLVDYHGLTVTLTSIAAPDPFSTTYVRASLGTCSKQDKRWLPGGVTLGSQVFGS